MPQQEATAAAEVLAQDPGIAGAMPGTVAADGVTVMIQAVPTVDPSDPALAQTVDRLRADLPPGALIAAGAAVENLDRRTSSTPRRRSSSA